MVFFFFNPKIKLCERKIKVIGTIFACEIMTPPTKMRNSNRDLICELRRRDEGEGGRIARRWGGRGNYLILFFMLYQLNIFILFLFSMNKPEH